MTKCGRWFVSGLVVTGLWVAPAQAEPVSSLDEAVKRAITDNPEVRASWREFEASEAAVRATRGGYYPSIDLDASVGHERQDPNNLPSFSYDPWHAQLSLTQMLYDGFETRNLVDQFSHERKRLYYAFRQASETAALEATQAWLDVHRFQSLVSLAKDNYVQHRSIYRDIEKRARAGVGRKVDVEQASARLALAETNLLTEVTNLHDVSARFQRVVGELPAEQLTSASFDTAGIPADPRSALNLAYKDSPLLNSAVENTQAAQAARDVRDAPMKPRLDLRLRHELEDDTDGVAVRKDTSAVELVLSYNLYRGGADRARITEAERLMEQAFELQRKACRDVRQELVIAHNDISSLTEQLQYLDRNQLAVGKARTQYRKQFDIGKRTLLDLLDTENEYFDVRRAYINNEHNLMVAQARTLATMGRLVSAHGNAAGGLENAAVHNVDTNVAGRCPDNAVPTMSRIDKQALLASVLNEPEFREIGNNQLAYRMNAHFGYNSSKLNNRYEPDIARAAQFLQRYPDVKAIIEGHTDSRGSNAYNQRLSERRANAVYRRLVEQHGVDPARLSVKGYGESRPMATNNNAKGRQLNRRVDMVIEKPRRLDEQQARYTPVTEPSVRISGGFGSGSANLTPQLRAEIPAVLNWLEQNRDERIQIAGFTDSVGSQAYNRKLSERRARAIYDHLVRHHGVDPERLEVVGYGEAQPVADNRSREGRAQNRRVELRLLS